MPDMKEVSDEVTKVARDAMYVAVGLGVLGFQRAQVRRQQVLKNLAAPRAEVEDRLGELVKHAHEQALEAGRQLKTLLRRAA